MLRPTEIPPLGVAVIGLGWWGRTIAALLKGHKKFRLEMGVDTQPVKIDGLRVEKSLEAALREPRRRRGDPVHAAHAAHRADRAGGVEAGKYVFCEKPLSLSRAAVLRAVAECNRNGVKLAVGHEKRFEPPIREVFRMAQAGQLGALLQVEANFSQDKFLALPADNWRLSAEGGAGRPDHRHRHPPARPVDRPARAGRPGVGELQPARQLAGNGDTLGAMVPHKSGANALLSAILATPFDGRFAVYGSRAGPRCATRRTPRIRGVGHLLFVSGINQQESSSIRPRKAVLSNLEAFADACGRTDAVSGAAGADDRQRVGARGSLCFGEDRSSRSRGELEE